MPFPECPIGCQQCNRRVRSQAERLVRRLSQPGTSQNITYFVRDNKPLYSTLCRVAKAKFVKETIHLREMYSTVDPIFPFCAYVHLLNQAPDSFVACEKHQAECECKAKGREYWFNALLELGEKDYQNMFG